jgi:hypothetical protein
MIQFALTKSTFEKFRNIIPFFARLQSAFADDCGRLLENADLMASLRATGYDVAIMDPAFVRCYVLPYALQIPYHTSLSVPCYAMSYRVPRLPSFVSEVGHTDRMSFFERLMSFIQTFLLAEVMVTPDIESSQQFAPHRPPIDVYQLLLQSSLWFYMEDPVVSFPRPVMPNTVLVGDLMAGRPGGRLPDNFEQFLAQSTGGAIIVSFGSFLDHIPIDILRQFCEAFAGLGDASVGVIWKQTNQSACDGVVGFDRRRVLLLPWLPQNDLLADSRIRLFVTHGGLNSVVEAVFHGKPLVVLPVSLDQPANAAMVAAKGYGVRLNLDSAEPDIASALTTAIRTVLNDRSYAERVQQGASMMHDRRDTAAERVSYAIDHVIKYGDAHLRTGAFQLSFWQYIMFDLFAALAAASIFVTCCVSLICRAVLRRCCSRRIKQKTA